jgi:hypothetical protein
MARDIWVDNLSGADKNQGTQPKNVADISGPVRTIAKAVRLAQPGDRIMLAKTGQAYRECVTLGGDRRSGNALLPFVLDGNGETLDGSQVIPSEQWKNYHDNIFRFRPLDMAYPVLFVNGEPIPPRKVNALSSAPPELKPLEWCVVSGAIYFAVEKDKLPSDYQFARAALSAGISLFHVDRVQIENLIVRGFRIDGIAALDEARHVVLKNVTCIANGHSGVSVAGASQLELSGCKLSGNGVAQLFTTANNELHIYASTLDGNSAPGLIDQGSRVYLGKQRIFGGRKSVQPDDAPQGSR